MTDDYAMTPLARLQFHWGEAYEIWHQGLTWVAQRRDNRATLRADSPEALRDLIIADYTARPVPRSVG